MILLAIDFETTGLDLVNDRPIEAGLILYSTGQKRILETQGFLVRTDLPITAEVNSITGITKTAIEGFGYDSTSAFETIFDMAEQADAYIGHNVNKFDKAIFKNLAVRESILERQEIPDKLWIDTYTDLPGAKPGTLTHMAADHGVLNLFPHGAITDCLTVLKLIELYDIEKVVERSKSPWVVIQAHQARHENELAKKAKFRWRPEPYKMWWKFCKEIDVESFTSNLPFDVSVHRENIEEFQDL